MIVITPTFQTADEPAHFYQAWSVASFRVVSSCCSARRS